MTKPDIGKDAEQLELNHCWWERKLAQPIWQYLLKLKIHLRPSNFIPEYMPNRELWIHATKGVYMVIRSRTPHISAKLETP